MIVPCTHDEFKEGCSSCTIQTLINATVAGCMRLERFIFELDAPPILVDRELELLQRKVIRMTQVINT